MERTYQVRTASQGRDHGRLVNIVFTFLVHNKLNGITHKDFVYIYIYNIFFFFQIISNRFIVLKLMNSFFFTLINRLEVILNH